MESYSHLDLKHDLFWLLRQDGYDVEIEKAILGKYKPDLLVKTKNNQIAIEIQKSPLSVITLIKRMQAHTEANAHTLWLIPQEVLETLIHRKKWCELIQQIQFGLLFILTKECRIFPARLDRLGCGNRRFVDYWPESILIDEVQCVFNPMYGINICTWNEWWLEGYVENIDIR